MLHYAVLICSDEACPQELEAWGPLEQLEALACDCGCALQVVAISDVELIDPAFESWSLPLAA